jgi:hypothetical protein
MLNFLIVVVIRGCIFGIKGYLFNDKRAIGGCLISRVQSSNALAGAKDFRSRWRASNLSLVALHESLKFHQ